MPKSRTQNVTRTLSEDLGTKPSDAAVRRAIIEARSEILNFLHRRLGNRDIAEDVLQHFSVRALERASELRDVRSVRGWLGRILATTIVDHQRRSVRKNRREVALEQTEFDTIASEPERGIDETVCNCFHKILPTLKAEYADVIWRADLLGEPRARIAKSLGVTLNNVTVRLHRGRQALRIRLEEMCTTCPKHGFLYCRCAHAKQGSPEPPNSTGRPNRVRHVRRG